MWLSVIESNCSYFGDKNARVQAHRVVQILKCGGIPVRQEKGVYTLIISVPTALSLKVGRLGPLIFDRGLYLYTGSAHGPGGLDRRIARHLRKRKKQFWHIDYLLARKGVIVMDVISAPTSGHLECTVNRCLGASFPAPNRGFGSSDCTGSCSSHLLTCNVPLTKARDIVCESYRRCGLHPVLGEST